MEVKQYKYYSNGNYSIFADRIYFLEIDTDLKISINVQFVIFESDGNWVIEPDLNHITEIKFKDRLIENHKEFIINYDNLMGFNLCKIIDEFINNLSTINVKFFLKEFNITQKLI